MSDSVSLTCPRSVLRHAYRVWRAHNGCIDNLLAQKSAYAVGMRQDRFFVRAMNEAFAYHFIHCAAYRARCLASGILPGNMPDLESVWAIPSLAAADFEQSSQWLDSHRTKQSHLDLKCYAAPWSYADACTLRRVRRMSANMGQVCGLCAKSKSHYLLIRGGDMSGKELNFATELAQAHTRKGLVRNVHYLDNEALRAMIGKFKRNAPQVRVIGEVQTLRGVSPNVMTYDGEYPKCLVLAIVTERDAPIFKATIQQELAGLWHTSAPQVRAMLLLSGQRVVLYSCSHGNFHIPAYMRSVARSVATGAVLSAEDDGELRFYLPHCATEACLAVNSGVYGHWQVGCPCGCQAPFVVWNNSQH